MNNLYQKPYVIGMDGGGTKTKICSAYLDGTIFDSFTGGSMNINSQGEAGVKQNLAQIFNELKNRGADWPLLKGICLGAAGISNPLARQTLQASVQTAGIRIEPILLGDHQIALYGAHEAGQGIILIAGTGSVCYGIGENAQEVRVGGFGHLIDDEGSGYAIGRDVLSAVVRAEDGREQPTCMKEAVLAQLKLSGIAELIQYIYSPSTGKKEIAALAPIVMQGVQKKEQAAERILEKASDYLAEMVITAVRCLNRPQAEVAFCGSVLLKNEILAEKLKQKIHAVYPAVNCIKPKQDAAAGAVLRCLEEIQK